MSARQDIVLSGMRADVQPLKQCAPAPTGCGQMKPPNGGIDLSPDRWCCAGCWTRRQLKRRRK